MILFERPKLKQKILELCEKANYIVRVSSVSDDNIKVLTLFPDRKFGKPIYSRQELIHEVEYKEKVLLRRFDEKWRIFEVPPYLVRPFIIQDIYLKCSFLGIDKELVIGFDSKSNKVSSLINAIPEPKDNDKELESFILSIYQYPNIDHKKNPKYSKVSIMVNFLNKFLIRNVERFFDEDLE